MEKLTLDWITQGSIDFEYKKYILLAYLKQVKHQFATGKLYPQLSELITHYHNLMVIKEQREGLLRNFKGRVTGMDFDQLQLVYEEMVTDEEVMAEIHSIISYALPLMQQHIEEGREIYDLVEQNLKIDAVGLMPIYQKEGYLLIAEEVKQELAVFQYEVALFEKAEENYRSIRTTFISREIKSLARSVQQIKLDLIKRFKELPNPATFLVTSKLHFPVTETILPVAKRHLIRTIEIDV